MFASQAELDTLKRLQEVDGELVRLEKELANLPQYAAIADTRKKLADIVAKKVQVQDMLDEAEEKFEALEKEDEELIERQHEAEKNLEENQADYRMVKNYTNDLNTIAKQREKLSVKIQAVENQLNKINPVMKQIMAACVAHEQKEKELIVSFKQEGGALQNRIVAAKKLRKELAESLSGEVLKVYEQKKNVCGPIALAVVENGSCSACRMKFDVGRMSMVKQDAPLSTCPGCRRLLIVQE
ncbi:MAG: zinc ribbon domain-containing protein [Anaerotardibacter sp.]